MRLAASLSFIMICTAGCATKNAPTSVGKILAVCHTSGIGEGCDNLNEKTITVSGFLDNGGYYNKPVLTPNASIIKNYDEDSLANIYAIEFLVSDVTRKRYAPYLGNEVVVTGKIFTNCVSKAIEMERFNREQYTKSENGDDEIVIRMLTGSCHYVTNPYMIDVTIEKVVT